MSLFWRIFGLNALVLGTATGVLMLAPVTVSASVLLAEAVVLVAGMGVMLVANAALLRVGLAPLERLTGLMATVDLLRPGQRLTVPGTGDVADLISTFNAMLDRLEAERAASTGRALSAQEAERRRIAQELHDEVGQSMTTVLLELKRAGERAPEALREDLRRAQETTRESLEEVRRLARRLRPGVLEDLGLVSALTSLGADLAGHTGMRVERRLDPELPALDPDVELVLYRVAQAALTNVVRHAAADRVELSLVRTGAAVQLRVADDGRGVGAAREGAGIRGMRERALLVGAALDVTRAPGGGTQVVLTVPAHGRPRTGTPDGGQDPSAVRR
ncbi:HAMP domain-containing sensor histidine kinase [Streptomyces sp. NBC_01808]|uniref:sensor histidine kinase n=1 Tax=Streptomyces sp. NBC_01808 TaxID=2975947 RepID=UPI002DD7E17A|nr:HAMP domain-containing sensor histidine kinase [Streptomyces sp. NBC_01808]WSA41773.1 HAMP domain-containing sensor histidine kinase [Streptomyces sp. NBC_01808]